MKPRTFLAAVAACSLTALLGACAAPEEPDAAAESDAISRRDARFGPRLFRDDFAAFLRRDGYTDEQIRRLAYLPTESVMNPAIRGENGPERLTAYDRAFKAIKPSELYAHGARVPLAPTEEVDRVLERSPVHIVILPGIFSEMIPLTPFEELFSADSAAKRSFAVKGAAVRDARYNVRALADEQRPLSELVRVGSIDSREGQPLVTAAYFAAGLGSLEDFGTLEQNSDVYLRRLDRYFEAIGGVPENLYLMGYSRGAVTGLAVLARAHRERKPWAAKVRGFISHAGVLYGSPLADASFTGGQATETLDLLRGFVGEKGREGELASCAAGAAGSPTLAERAATVGQWATFVGKFGALALRAPGHGAQLDAEGIDTNLPHVARITSFAARVLGIPLPGSPVSSDGIVDLSNAYDDHCANIERFKITARSIVAGAKTLTTEARVAWWSDPANVLPRSARYFALTGTMGDATGSSAWPLASNPTAYDASSVDYRSLRGNYYDLFAASGHQLQDSQVPVQRGRFWPELHSASAMAFNPRQGALRTYFMGTLGVHHWGLSFPRAFSTRGGMPANPFPRTTLLRTIGTFVAQVEDGDR